MNDLKKRLAKVPAILIQSRIIIVTIIVLIMMGFGLVQINSAITSEPSSANSDAQLQNQVLGKKVEFDDQKLAKILGLSGEKPNIEKIGTSKTRNPFKSD